MLKKIFAVVGSNGLAQILVFAITPIAARYYSADVFGLFGYVSAIAGVLIPFFTLRLELALPVSKNRKVSNYIVSVSLTLVVLVCLIASALSVIAYFFIMQYVAPELDHRIILFVPFWTAALALFQVITYQNIYKGTFFKLGLLNISRAAAVNLIVFIPLIFGFGNGIWFVLTKIIALSLFSIVYFTNLYRKGDIVISRRAFQYVFQKFKDYRKHSVFQAVLNSIGHYLPHLTFSALFGANVLGQLSMAYMLVQAPIGIISQSVRQVFHNQFSNLWLSSKEKGLSLYIKAMILLFLCIICLNAVFWFVGDFVFDMYLGKGWELTFVFSKWLLIWFSMLLVNPISQVALQVAEKQKILSFYEGAYLFVRIVFLIFFAAYLTDVNIVIILSAIGFLFNLFIVLFVLFILWSMKQKQAKHANSFI